MDDLRKCIGIIRYLADLVYPEALIIQVVEP